MRFTTAYCMFLYISTLHYHVTVCFKHYIFHENAFFFLYLHIWKNYKINDNDKDVPAFYNTTV